jgi:hypothetical protein
VSGQNKKTGQAACQVYCEVLMEQGELPKPWNEIGHNKRFAWEATAQFLTCPPIDRKEQAHAGVK